MSFPSKFGKYLLLERVNVGGMAEVFKAKTSGAGFERIIAIKRILPNLVEDDDFIRMFIDEARIAVQLNHANIVQIYELGKQGEHYYIAMEYVPSRDLRGILDRLRASGQLMPIAQAAYITARVAEGLDYAHRRKDPQGNPMNIIHRDVSPQNVLVGFDGEVKVIDFGIAKAANRASKTQAGVLKGKFGYMSPEQVRGLPIDRRSDIFAVGVLLYEMLTGERLFIGESDFSTLERVRNADVIPPTSFNKKISPQLEQIVLKTLAREVEDRYQWASELAADLQGFMGDTAGAYNVRRLATSMRDMYALEVAQEKKKQEEFLRVKADSVAADKNSGQHKVLPLPTRGETSMGPAPGDEEEEGEFGEDKTFVIEASAAGMALGVQETDPHLQQGRPGAPSATAPPNRQPLITASDDDDVSLYGAQDDDDDDSRTLVGAENPYYSNPGNPALATGPQRVAAANQTMEQPLSEVSQPPALQTAPSLAQPATAMGGPSYGGPSLPPNDPVAAAMAYDDVDASGYDARPAEATASNMAAPMASMPSMPSMPSGQPIAPMGEPTPDPSAMARGAPPAAQVSWAPAIALMAIGGLLFLGGAAFAGIRLLGSGTSSPAQLELVAAGTPPADVVVTLDGAEIGRAFPGGTLIAPLTEGEHTLTVVGGGQPPLTRTVRGTGGTVRQPVLFLATSTPPSPPDNGTGDAVADGGAPATDTPPPTDAPPADPADVKAVGGWRLLLAAVAADGVPVEGADVLVNGVLVGQTPLETELSDGLDAVKVQVRKEGFAPREVAVSRAGRAVVGPATVPLTPGDAGPPVAATPARTPPTEPPPTGNPEAVAKNDPVPEAPPDPTPDPTPEPTPEKADPTTAPDKPESKPDPSPPRATPKRVIAKIQLGTAPFAETTIDGRKFGTTPFFGPRTLSLPVGRHKVEFVDKSTGKKYTYQLTIKGVDPNNKAVIPLNADGGAPRVTGQVELKKL